MPSSPSRKTKARKISERGGKTRNKIVYTAGKELFMDMYHIQLWLSTRLSIIMRLFLPK